MATGKPHRTGCLRGRNSGRSSATTSNSGLAMVLHSWWVRPVLGLVGIDRPALLANRLVLRRRRLGMREVFAHVQDVLPAERIAVMRSVQRAFDAVESHAPARLGQRLGRPP